MSIKTFLLSLTVIVAFHLNCGAVIFQKLVKSNGDELFGYTAVQNPSEGTIVFRTDSSLETIGKVLTMDGKSYASFGSKLYPVKVKVMYDDDRAQCVVKGTRDVTVKLDDVSIIYNIDKDKNVVNGQIREYIMTDGTRVKGRLFAQSYGNSNNIILEKRGADKDNKEMVKLANVAVINTLPLNNKQSLWIQTRLLDEVVKKNGDKTDPGVIIERNYKSAVADSFYVVLQHRQGRTERIYFKQIKEFRRVVNKDYCPLVMHVLRSGEIEVNGKPASNSSIPIVVNTEEGYRALMQDNPLTCLYKSEN